MPSVAENGRIDGPDTWSEGDAADIASSSIEADLVRPQSAPPHLEFEDGVCVTAIAALPAGAGLGYGDEGSRSEPRFRFYLHYLAPMKKRLQGLRQEAKDVGTAYRELGARYHEIPLRVGADRRTWRVTRALLREGFNAPRSRPVPPVIAILHLARRLIEEADGVLVRCQTALYAVGRDGAVGCGEEAERKMQEVVERVGEGRERMAELTAAFDQVKKMEKKVLEELKGGRMESPQSCEERHTRWGRYKEVLPAWCLEE
ncbi:hypothetical protein LTR09_011147 [Extremus antarcticus]|uniref:Uncharacterized protein n=1 Tax=Extremus antarcticus TaxID=702011 RepID=A0AAJ0DC84_9PEZI|nr:hypothetical protein LTR09_011147 [Extremus antarcticus]